MIFFFVNLCIYIYNLRYIYERREVCRARSTQIREPQSLFSSGQLLLLLEIFWIYCKNRNVFSKFKFSRFFLSLFVCNKSFILSCILFSPVISIPSCRECLSVAADLEPPWAELQAFRFRWKQFKVGNTGGLEIYVGGFTVAYWLLIGVFGRCE